MIRCLTSVRKGDLINLNEIRLPTRGTDKIMTGTLYKTLVVLDIR